MRDIETRRTLLDSGLSTAAIRTAVSSGRLERLRNGWFASPGCPPDLARAVRLGGRLTCVSELRRRGLWVITDGRLHVAVSPDASRLRSPDDRHRRWSPEAHPDVCLHWTPELWNTSKESASECLADSIGRMLRCQPLDNAIATIDSALNLKLVSMPELVELLEGMPARYARVRREVDATAQSGTESLARLRLRRRGLTVRTQVVIRGVGIVDLMVGDRLVIEIDSRSHHLGNDYEKDRARDLELFRLGYSVIRVSYRRVMYDWPAVESAILEAARRGEHRLRALHRRQGLR
jgi:very-short-patch-repair endonuclease